MEIERKWMVTGWPEGLVLEEEFAMRQGYISVQPTVRIREEALTGGKTSYVLCFKSGGGLAREEIERDIDEALFRDLETKIIAKPLIPKLRRSYRLPDGAVLEVNHVDEGQPTEFWYAEVEYPTVEAARSWQPEAVGLADYLRDESHRPARSEHGCLLGADPGLKGRKTGFSGGKNLEKPWNLWYHCFITQLAARTARWERRIQTRNDLNSRWQSSTIRRSS